MGHRCCREAIRKAVLVASQEGKGIARGPLAFRHGEAAFSLTEVGEICSLITNKYFTTLFQPDRLRRCALTGSRAAG